MKNPTLILIHRWGGTPSSDWYPWLKQKCEQELGLQVIVPQMPDTETPRIDAWVNHLAHMVSLTKNPVILVGHSIGCQTILRYLATNPASIDVKGVILVAPWFNLIGLTDEEKEISQPWIETPIDLEIVKKQTLNTHALFSNSDYYVSLEEKELFEQKLAAKTHILANHGHFTSEDGVIELPLVFNLLKQLTQNQ